MTAESPGAIKVSVAARLLMISDRRVQQLASQGWIPRPYSLVGVVQGYLKFLQDEQRKQTRTAGEEEMRRERVRKLRLHNDETERQLVRSDDVLAAIDAILGPCKADLSAVAARTTDDIEMRRKIEDGIDAALAALADRADKAGADLLAGRDALETVGQDPADGMGAAESEISGERGAPGPT